MLEPSINHSSVESGETLHSSFYTFIKKEIDINPSEDASVIIASRREINAVGVDCEFHIFNGGDFKKFLEEVSEIQRKELPTMPAKRGNLVDSNGTLSAVIVAPEDKINSVAEIQAKIKGLPNYKEGSSEITVITSPNETITLTNKDEKYVKLEINGKEIKFLCKIEQEDFPSFAMDYKNASFGGVDRRFLKRDPMEGIPPLPRDEEQPWQRSNIEARVVKALAGRNHECAPIGVMGRDLNPQGARDERTIIGFKVIPPRDPAAVEKIQQAWQDGILSTKEDIEEFIKALADNGCSYLNAESSHLLKGPILVHGRMPKAIQEMQRGEFASANVAMMSQMPEEYRAQYMANIQSLSNCDSDLYPDKIHTRCALSCSLLGDRNFRTWGDYGVIVKPPMNGVVGTYESDAAVDLSNTAKMINDRNRCSIMTPDKMQNCLSTNKLNEVNILGTDENESKTEIIGYFIKVDSSGREMDPVGAAQVKLLAKKYGLPCLKIQEIW